MSKSIVYELKSKKLIPAGSPLEQRFLAVVGHLFQFLTDNPTVEVFNESENGSDFSHVRSEVRCVDQSQLDLYLASPDNLKSTVDAMNSDANIKALCKEVDCTLTVAIVDDTTTSRGKMTVADLAQAVAQVSANV